MCAEYQERRTPDLHPFKFKFRNFEFESVAFSCSRRFRTLSTDFRALRGYSLNNHITGLDPLSRLVYSCRTRRTTRRDFVIFV